MPIKLLHHKSWHVYNKDNIARVARDEAAEKARVEAEEAARRSVSSQARLDALRGTNSTLPKLTDESLNDHQYAESSRNAGTQRKRKREDETSIIDRQLSGQARDEALPESEHVVKPNAQDNATFSTLNQQTWYTQSEYKAVETKPRKKEERKDTLDPLREMNAFLARKKALKREKERQARDSGEMVPEDRYNPAPEKRRSHSRYNTSDDRQERQYRRQDFGTRRHRDRTSHRNG